MVWWRDPPQPPAAIHGDSMTINTGPLAGLKILEIESIGPGPFAAMTLADLGANVLQVDCRRNARLALCQPMSYTRLSSQAYYVTCGLGGNFL
jgi:crotonobetainyl-CoA:carnitine CoA-transferase CaiB-like acyl-CoA transferase